jgi:pullulanase/glycogen debranching enzyme
LTAESTDPYSRCTAANGERSMVVNLSDDDLAPRGWRERRGWGEAGSRQMEGWGDASVYELHIRDFR